MENSTNKLDQNQYYYADEVFVGIRSDLKNELISLKKDLNFTAENPINRTYIKTFISLIEGTLNYLDTYLLDQYKQNKINLSFEEESILRGKSYQLSNKGEIKINETYYPFLSKFKFTYKLFARLFNRKQICNTYFDLVGFRKFQNTIKIRHRISHPKKQFDVFVSGEEVKCAFEAYVWHEKFQTELFQDHLYVKK